MKRYDIHTCGLTEIRWAGSGIIASDDKAICYSGRDKHERWVTILLNKDAAQFMYRYLSTQPTMRRMLFTPTWLHYVRVFAIAISSVVCLSATLVHPTQGVEPFGNISSLLCTLAILWPLCKILRRSSQGNPCAGGVKRKRGIKIQRFCTYPRLS